MKFTNGLAFPVAIGASIAKNKAKIICIDEDGSIQINIQELQTVVYNKLPIKIIVLNNNGYGIIKQFQELYLKKDTANPLTEFLIQILKMYPKLME